VTGEDEIELGQENCRNTGRYNICEASSITAEWPQIAQIEKRLSVFKREVFAAVIKSFQQIDNPLHLNNFAMGLRELSRIVLHDLAPDADIKACCWYREEKNKDGAVVFTRQQRIKYAVHAGLPEDFVENTLLVDVEETINEFRDLVNTLSKFTHVGPTTFNVGGADADDLARQALDTFIMLFDTIDECRKQVRTEMEDHVKNAVDDELLETTIQELDELATHHQVEGCNIDNLKLVEMNANAIKFELHGSVDCQLQYGSDGDYERGDGVRVDDNYPLTCQLVAEISNPLKLTVEDLKVDNSSFYE